MHLARLSPTVPQKYGGGLLRGVGAAPKQVRETKSERFDGSVSNFYTFATD